MLGIAYCPQRGRCVRPITDLILSGGRIFGLYGTIQMLLLLLLLLLHDMHFEITRSHFVAKVHLGLKEG